jgi:hypothetical protein
VTNRNGAYELGLIVAVLALAGPFLSDATLWIVTGLVVLAAAAGTAGLLGRTWPRRWPIDRLILPSIAAFASLGIARLFDPVPWLAFVAALSFAMIAWVVAIETAPVLAYAAATPDVSDAVPEAGSHARATSARLATFGLAFAGFAAIGGLVPGGVAGEGQPLTLNTFLAVVMLDLVIGGLAGYRLVALHPHTRGQALTAIYVYVLAMTAGGVTVRVLGLPRLFGPAELVLLLYLVTSLRESGEPIRRNARLIEETAILSLFGVVVAVLGLLVH